MATMASTRRQPGVQIFQDPVSSHNHHEAASIDAHLLAALGPVTDVSSDQHTLLEPPQSHINVASSPRKSRHVSSSPPPAALVEKAAHFVPIPPPQENRFRIGSPVKKVLRPLSKQARAMAAQKGPVFATFPSQFDKENIQSVLDDHRLPEELPIDVPPKPASKPALPHAAPLRDRSRKQKIREAPPTEEAGPLPEPENMPPVQDDGTNTKPLYSYAHLIGMAILRAPNRRLTLAQIYKWISDTFQYYRETPEMGWQNSIRHNLSLSKAFSKQERPKNDPGKGHYWRINEGFESQFYKVKTARRTTNPDSFMQPYTSDTVRPMSASASFPLPSTVAKSDHSSKFPEETELSSDATIPCSDPAPHEGLEPESSMRPPRHIPSSPPPADIQSSPPAAGARSVREDTPPRAVRVPSHSRSGGRKRKFKVFGDSGYYSSIESSAVKGNPLGTLLTSEADLERPTIKRGRAEEEIARIRGSSYDSPTKTRPFMQQPGAAPLISSPSRAARAREDDPLTPAVIFKRPALPPPSASPNTNLRNHRKNMRELVGASPDKRMAVLSDNGFLQGFSPAIQISDEDTVNVTTSGFESAFDVFSDYHYLESPSKPSNKRPRLDRAATTGGILADITGTSGNAGSETPNSNWKSPFLNMPSFDSPCRNASPVKAPTSNPVPAFTLSRPDSSQATGLSPPQTLGVSHEELFLNIYSDESEEAGFDLTQSFPRIGANFTSTGSPTKMPRPALGRSATTRF